METFAVDWLVLAQTTETGASAFSAALDSLRGFATVAIVALVLFGLPALLARWLTRSVFRMGDDYVWRVAIVLSTVFCAVAILWPTGVLPKSESWRGWPPKLGIDLQGGVILVYEMVDQGAADPTNPEAAAARISVEDLVEPLRRRLDPGGIKEIVVRPYGQRQIEIIIPEVEAGEVEQVKKTISTAGHLQFRILVDAMLAQDERHVNAALDEANRKKDVLTVRVGDAEEPLAQWMRIARDDRTVRIQAVEVPDPKDPSKTIRIDEIRPLKFYPSGGNIVRDAETFEIVNLPYVDWEENKRTHQFERNMLERGIGELDVLVRMDDRFNVEGGDLEYATSGFDDRGGNAVHFNMTAQGAQKMARLTSTHLPTSDHKYQMGIILDDEVLSAPTINDTISDRGMISGSFTDQEVTFLVRILQGGRLPASLNKSPISQNSIDPLLGEATIRSSMISMVLAMAVTLLFIIFWYRAAGLVASVALLLNLAFTLSLMVLFSVALSLPGVAGLILSVGMSVDANILIFERMREERLKGSSFRLAIRNGFSRASTTIIDSNLTTLITAFVLYFIGTDQLKGFAITLILGIVTSMFTAIFVARLIFEICERRGWLTDIYAFAGIQKWLVEKGIDFVRLQTACGIVSAVLTVGALAATFARGGGIFDIDFTGGTSVVMLLDKPVPQSEVDAKLREAFRNVRVNDSSLSWSVTQIGVAGGEGEGNLRDRSYKVDSSFPTVEELENALGQALTVDGQPLLASYSMEFTSPEQTTKTVPVRGTAATADDAEIEVDVDETPAEEAVPAAPEPGSAETTPAPSATETTPEESAPAPAPEGDAPAPPAGAEESTTEETTPPAEPEPGSSVDAGSPSEYFVNVLLQEEQPAAEAPADDAAAPETPAAEAPAAQPPARPDFAQPPAREAAAGEEAETPAAPATREIVVSASKVTMENAINAGSLIDRLVEASAATGEPLNPNEIDLLPIGAGAADWSPESELPFREWQVTLERPADQALSVLQNAKQAFASDFVFLSSSEIGGQVAGKTKTMAAFALLFSLIGIVLYIWFRFHRVLYGVAAVIALVHTVIVTLGAVAVSYWLANYVPGMRLLGIDEFKISLPVIASFLTLIGYAINDTIVVFDRIREVRGKAPYLNAQMINLSVNSTLSRTLLTSVTILASLVILYVWGGEGIHGFAFVLIVGILVGTYSSIFIASPVLLWMSQRTEVAAPGGQKKKPTPKTA